MLRKRFLSVLLTLALLVTVFSGTFTASAADSSSSVSAQNGISVIYIPLDNRPFNYATVVNYAKSIGVNLIMPDDDLFSTKLDGQPLNASGQQCGDRASLYEWLIANAGRADVLVLSLDQLLSGGLMSSRAFDSISSITLSDGTVISEYDIIDYIASLAEDHEVYLLDSVLRLAASCGYGGYDLEDYAITRAYGRVQRPLLTGDSLTLENILATYRSAEDGTEAIYEAGLSDSQIEYFLSSAASSASAQATGSALPEDEDPALAAENDILAAYVADAGVTDEAALAEAVDSWQSGEGSAAASATAGPESNASDAENITEAEHSRLQTYLDIRARKLRLNAYAIEKLAGLANTHFYLGIDDSSTGGNLQTNEIAYLEKLAGSNVTIIDTLDGITQQLLTEITVQALHAEVPTASVTWFGDGADSGQTYSRITNRESTDEIAARLGMELVTDSADISILAYTDSSSTARGNIAVYRLASQINDNEAAGIPTILLNYAYFTEQQKQILAENCHLGWLLSVTGDYRSSSAVMAISQGIGRYVTLAADGYVTDELNQAHLENLTEEFAYIYYQTSTAQSEMTALVKSYGLDTNNFGGISTSTQSSLNSALTSKVQESMSAALESISGSNYIVSLEPYQTAGIESVELVRSFYPWDRTFEAEFVMHAELGSDCSDTGSLHKSFANGTTTTTFSPTGTATREQLATLLVRISGIKVSTTTDRKFTDVASFAAASVQTAVENGWVHGYSDGTFRGSSPMTRVEFCTMLVNYLKATGGTLEPVRDISFSDVPETGKWYSENVLLMARAGYINGYTDGSFCPQRTITRAESIALLCRIFGRTEQLSDTLSSVPRFTDVSSNYWAFRYIQEASVSHFCMD